MTDNNTPQLIRELNKFAEERFERKQFVEAEERYRTAIEVYLSYCVNGNRALTEVLTSITGLVRCLEAQGRSADAVQVLEDHDPTIKSIVDMLKKLT